MESMLLLVDPYVSLLTLYFLEGPCLLAPKKRKVLIRVKRKFTLFSKEGREMTRAEIEQMLQKQKTHLKEKFFVDRIGLFGSYARDEQKDNSDIDLVVEFTKPVGFEFFDLKDYLETIFNKKVDLVTIRSLKPMIKDEIIAEVQFQ
jgi:predicted nucleotidyltransferase